jgi:type IV pilus assembly protein PilA
MNNKKGFSLVELIAVVIILGVIMLIAVPNIGNTIEESRKKAYVETANRYVDIVRTKVGSGEIRIDNPNVTYYISYDSLHVEQGGDSPYGKWISAYVVAVYDSDQKKVIYYWTSIDETGHKILLKNIEEITIDDIFVDTTKSETDTRRVGLRENIVTIKSDGTETESRPILSYTAAEADVCYTYFENDNGTITIESYNKNCPKNVEIPSIIDGNVYFSGMTKDNYSTEVNYNIVVHVARKKINVTNTYNGIAGTNLGNVLVYQVSNNDTLNSVNLTQNGVTLKTANVNGKYGLYLMGTPEKAGTIHFTGVTYNSNKTENNYDINYNITVNVAAKTRQVIEVTKSYNGTVGKSIGDILVYQSDKLQNISSTRNGLTLKTDTDGLRLSGTPTQPGTLTFTGTTYEGDSYTIKFNVTINIPNPTKPSYKVEKLFNAVVNKFLEGCD